jgi:hypothetical protein
MTKILLLFLLYSVVVAIMKKRAAKQAAENGDDGEDGDELEMKPAPAPPQKEKGRKTIDLGPDRSYKEAGAKAPDAKAQKVRGRSVTTESEETDRDEHRRSQRGSTDWEADEHAPSPFRKSNPAKAANNPPSQSEAPTPAKKAGREVLEILARELGLPIPTEPTPPSRPAPAKYKPPVIPEVESAAAKKPARPTISDEVRNSNWDGKRAKDKSAIAAKAKADDPYARQGFASNGGTAKYASRLSAESLREPGDVANAIVMQSLLGEPPGMRYWKQRLHPKSVSPLDAKLENKSEPQP